MTGFITLNLYFGTKYDIINIPYSRQNLRNEATKTITVTGQVVWQTTFLQSIRANIDDYQDIVGAQFAEIIDENTPPLMQHWYEVVGYNQVSRKTVELGLLYDPLLSIGIQHITNISGIMQRWTVDNDEHFKYIFSEEPIDQIDAFEYYYATVNNVDITTQGKTIAGFPYDMTQAPSILEYVNSDGTNTNIYSPVLTGSNTQTTFTTNIPDSFSFLDGFSYYLWNPNPNNVVYKTYNQAVSLGYDLISNAYILPSSGLIVITSDSSFIVSIVGQSDNYNTGLALYDSTYRNNKANEIGTFFTLYNEFTGDSVTVNNFDLANTTIDVFVNPYSDGCFYARFSGYLNDSNGVSGLIKSCGWQPLTITSNVGFGTALNTINNTINKDVISVSERAQYRTADVNADTQLAALRTSSENQLISQFYRAFSNVMNTPINNIKNSALNNISEQLVSGILTNRTAATGVSNIASLYNANISNIADIMSQQRNALTTQGNIGKTVPPLAKFAQANVYSANSYVFKIRKSTYSANDKKRADNFFTAYGYNVNNAVLNNPNQLYCRDNFTFIQADNVEITGVDNGVDLTRLRDIQTIKYIQDRFSSGIRIWKTTPNYNWDTITNPITGVQNG